MVDNKKGGERNEKVTVELHSKEYKLICFIRELGFGTLTVTVRDNLPDYADRVVEKIKFN